MPGFPEASVMCAFIPPPEAIGTIPFSSCGIVNVPHYKTFISRAGKQVARATLLRRWENMMDIRDKDQKRGLDYPDDLYGTRLKRDKS